MSKLQYDICTYLTSTKMSSKVRILVEGKDDRAHISNLINTLCTDIKFKVDVAAELKGICQETSKNNRAKIEKAHEITKLDPQYSKIIFLCDRETRGFSTTHKLQDQIGGHYVDGRLSWTLGHSIENYFIDSTLLNEGLRFLTSSQYKIQASALFSKCLHNSIRTIAKLTLAAHEFGNVSYPCGVIGWKNIKVDPSGSVEIDFSEIENPIIDKFEALFERYKNSIAASDYDTCVLLCRGHTALIFIKRIYAACLYEEAKISDDSLAELTASTFENISESQISAALSEAWIRSLDTGKALYPRPLIETIQAIAC